MCEYDLGTGPRKLLYTIPKLFYIAIFVLSILHFRIFLNRDDIYDHNVAAALTRIFVNFDQQPIQAITLSEDRTCGSKFSPTNLFLWSGTSPGCYCGATSTIINNTCVAAGFPTCTNVPATSSIYIKEWRNMTICLQRTSTLQYYPTSNCPSSMKRCSLTTCIDMSEDCPVTDVKMIRSNESTPENYVRVNLTGDHALIYTSVYNKEFLSDIKVSFFDKPCLIPSRRPLPLKGSGYPLLKIPDNGCGFYQGIDESFFIDQMPILDIFSDNNLLNSSTSSLPLIQTYISGEHAYLVGLKRYTVKSRIPICNNIDPNVLIQFDAEEVAFHDGVMGLSYSVIILCSIEFFVILFELIMRIKVGNERNQVLKWVSYFDLFFFFMICVMVIIEVGFILESRSRINQLIYYISYLVINLCFQQNEANSLLLLLNDSFGSDLWVLIGIGIAMICVAVVGLFLMLMPLVIDWCTAKEEDESFYSDIPVANTKKKGNKKPKNLANIEMLLKS